MSYNLWRSETDTYTLGFRMGISRSEPRGERMQSARPDGIDCDRVDVMIAHRLSDPPAAPDKEHGLRRSGGHTRP